MIKVKKFLKKWSFNSKWSNSLEPVILLFWGGWFLSSGAELDTDMLYRKICEISMGESFENCGNLTHLPDLKLNVTKEVNLFNIRGSYIKRVPPFVLALIGGSIFDNFNKKIFLILPILTGCLEPIVEFFNFYYFYSMPVEFMWLTDGIWSFGGGAPMFFMAQYGYISLIANPEDRVGRLSRVDAMEMLAPILFIPLSAPVFHLLGYCGMHAVKLVMYIGSLLYLFLLIEAPKTNAEREKKTCGETCKTLGTSFIDMLKTYFKKRKGYLRALIFVQMINFLLLNIVVMPLEYLSYPYVKEIFQTTGEVFATYKTTDKFATFLIMLILVPIVSKKFGVPDSIFTAFISFCSFAGLVLASVAPTYTWFFIGRVSVTLFFPASTLLRSQFYSCVDPGEIGRVFGGLALSNSLAEYISEPLFRGIFDSSIGGTKSAFYRLTGASFPGLFFLVSALMFLGIALICIFLHLALSREIRKRDVDMENKENVPETLGQSQL